MSSTSRLDKPSDNVFLGGALNKDDLFELLQSQIDTLSTKSKSQDGITRDDLKPLIKAIQDLRGVGMGSDEAVKKAVDFQMKMTRQIVVQQDIKTALQTRVYDEMKAANAKAKEIQLKTRQAKLLESELFTINKELLRKANEENDRLRKLQQQKDGATTSASSPPPTSPQNTSQTEKGTPQSGGGSMKRIFWRRADKSTKNIKEGPTPDDYQLDDERKSGGGDDASSSAQPPAKKGLFKQMSSRLSLKKGSSGNDSGRRNSLRDGGGGAQSTSADDLLLQDRPAVTFGDSTSTIQESQRVAQFDKLVEAMQKVKMVMDSADKGPSAILTAAGTDLDLVQGDPSKVDLWLGEFRGVVKASSSDTQSLSSSKTVLVGVIDSEKSHGRWEIRMARGEMMVSQPAAGTPFKEKVEEESKMREEEENRFLSQIELLRSQLAATEEELRQVKETGFSAAALAAGAAIGSSNGAAPLSPRQVRAAAPEVQALVEERSNTIRAEHEQQQEEERRIHKSVAGDSAKRNEDDEFKIDDLPIEEMTIKELKQHIMQSGGSVEGLREKDDLIQKLRELKGDTGGARKPRQNLEQSKSASDIGAAAADVNGTKLKDDERYAKYFKMLSIGLGKEQAQHKMTQDKLDPGILDFDPNTLVSVAEAELVKRKKAAAGEEDDDDDNGVKLKDDERYAKYFKMLKVGLTKDMVKHKMVQDGLDPDILDMDPEGPAGLVPPAELLPYLRMLQYQVPRAVVEYKMKSHGIDPTLLDKYLPSQDIPRLDIKVGEDPRFVPFFKMLAVGVPRDAVKQKMIQKGFDPAILDMDPNEFSPVDGSDIKPKGKGGKKAKRKRPDDGMQWKKLYWQPVEVPQPAPGVPITIWTKDFGFELLPQEKEEIKNLFAIKVGPSKDAAAANAAAAAQQDKNVAILESARAQNVSIILSKFKISIQDIKRMINTMRISEGLDLNPDDVKSILSMIPTPEEAEKLRALPPNKVELLGQAEKHFLGLLEVPRYKNRITCLLFKLQFKELREDIEFDIEALQGAIDDLMNSEHSKLPRLLSIILHIGNTLNSCGGLLTEEDGFKTCKGFRLSSLSKLRLAKAHTSNKTALNFFVNILHERQRQVLDFIIAESDNVRAAASVVMSNVKSQIKGLAMGVKDLENEVNHAESVRSDPEASKRITKEDEIFFDAVEAFFQKARRDVHDLNVAITQTEKDFNELIQYFREEADTTPEAFFKNLVTFFDDVAAALQENKVAKAKAIRKEVAQEQEALADML